MVVSLVTMDPCIIIDSKLRSSSRRKEAPSKFAPIAWKAQSPSCGATSPQRDGKASCSFCPGNGRPNLDGASLLGCYSRISINMIVHGSIVDEADNHLSAKFAALDWLDQVLLPVAASIARRAARPRRAERAAVKRAVASGAGEKRETG